MPTAQFDSPNVLNLRDHIEGQVIDAIVAGIFLPGDRLIETNIANQLGVSRAPVREVLSALEREGLVVNVPRHGYRVIDFTDKDIEEIYGLRMMLEREAVRRAILHHTEPDIAALQGLVDQLDATTSQGQLAELDLAFHERILRMADHSRLYAAWDSMSKQARLLISVTSRTHYDHPEQPKRNHAAILEALAAGDVQAAEARLTEHILDAKRRALGALRALRSTAPAVIGGKQC